MTSPLPFFLGTLFPLVNDGFHAVFPDAPSRVGISLEIQVRRLYLRGPQRECHVSAK